MPTVGFAPDADFPIIYAEKGSANFVVTRVLTEKIKENTAAATIITFESGQRQNMVPESARVLLTGGEGALIQIEREFGLFLTDHNMTGQAVREGRQLRLELIGKSAHAMDPAQGVNAGLYMAHFLDKQVLDDEGAAFVELMEDYLFDDPSGEKLGVAYNDDISGALTVNVGIIRYEKGTEARVHVNTRYPVTGSFDEIKSKVEESAQRLGFALKDARNSKPHFVDPDSPFIKILQRVYTEQTGQPAELIAIGGGTYARVLDVGVAFGPLFPNRTESAHQKDEHVYIEDMTKAIAIYAQAIYELANNGMKRD